MKKISGIFLLTLIILLPSCLTTKIKKIDNDFSDDEYISIYGQAYDEGYLFLSQRGKPFNRESLNKCVIAQVMKNVRINKKVSCYTFRHSIASHLVKNKVDIRYVGQLLGHEPLKTTQKYVHLEISDLKKMHSLYHPREQGG